MPKSHAERLNLSPSFSISVHIQYIHIGTTAQEQIHTFYAYLKKDYLLYLVGHLFYPPAFIKLLQCCEQVHKYLKAACAERLMRSLTPYDTRPSVWLLCNEVTWGLFFFATVYGT